ncbi:Rhodanese-like protein [Amylostereum chailletii]|nr:Rhodanese-like protein [Amylostereum chailletii]
MFRVAARSAARQSSRLAVAVARPIGPRAVVRFNSSKPRPTPEQKEAMDDRDRLHKKDWNTPILTYEEVKKRSEQPSDNAYLIDVREPDEVIQGSIPSSVNLPLTILSGSLNMPAELFEKKFGWNKPQPEQEIVFYCRSGKRSASAGDIARRNGYQNVLNYEGSWLDWVSKEGKPTS